MIDELNQFPKCGRKAQVHNSVKTGMVMPFFADLNELHSTGEVIDDCLPAAPMPPLDGEVILSAGDNDPVRRRGASPLGDQPMARTAMATALRGKKRKGRETPGICSLLGLKPFTPHDLRRTAATLAGDLGFDDAWIAKCLDHAASKKQEQIVPSVTGKVYNHSKRMKEKRAVLDGVAAELRRIIGQPAEAGLRLVA